MRPRRRPWGRGRRRRGQEGCRVRRRFVGLSRSNVASAARRQVLPAAAAATATNHVVAVNVKLSLGEGMLLSDVLAVPPDPPERQRAGLAVSLLRVRFSVLCRELRLYSCLIAFNIKLIPKYILPQS